MATFTQTISNAANSVRWFRNGTYFGNSEIWSGRYDNTTYQTSDSALLFTNVTVPKGATIISAVFSLNVKTFTGTPILQLRGEAADSPSAFTTTADGNGRTRTTASVNPGYTTTGNKDVDVSSIIAEIFARAGWASGNNLYLFLEDNGSSVVPSAVITDAVGTYARTLTIEYTIPPSLIRNNIMIF